MFHAELSRTFHSVRDLHTNYILPLPFSGKIAFLPFLVEEYFDDHGSPAYLVSRLMQGFTAPQFEHAEVKHWNGMPIERAVDLNAARFAGSNAAARHARGVESLTLRPLRSHLPAGRGVGGRRLRGRRRRRARAAAEVAGDETICPRSWRTPTRSALPPRRSGSTSSPTTPTARERSCSRPTWSRRSRPSRDPELSTTAAGRGRGRAHRDARRLPRPQRRDGVRHVRPRPHLHVQRRRPRAVRERVHPPDHAAAAGGPDRRRAWKRRRPHLRQRVHAPDAHAAAHRPRSPCSSSPRR